MSHPTQESFVNDIALALKVSRENLPGFLSEQEVAKVLGVERSTLAVWRTTGRYDLPFTKAGRLVRYSLSSVSGFIASRTRTHTGQRDR